MILADGVNFWEPWSGLHYERSTRSRDDRPRRIVPERWTSAYASFLTPRPPFHTEKAAVPLSQASRQPAIKIQPAGNVSDAASTAEGPARLINSRAPAVALGICAPWGLPAPRNANEEHAGRKMELLRRSAALLVPRLSLQLDHFLCDAHKEHAQCESDLASMLKKHWEKKKKERDILNHVYDETLCKRKKKLHEIRKCLC